MDTINEATLAIELLNKALANAYHGKATFDRQIEDLEKSKREAQEKLRTLLARKGILR